MADLQKLSAALEGKSSDLERENTTARIYQKLAQEAEEKTRLLQSEFVRS